MIPIRNIYYLFLYAWDKFAEGAWIEVGQDEGRDLPNLLARALVNSVRRQFRRNLDKGYAHAADELRFPRGKFQMTDTVKKGSFAVGRVVCEFDELNIDTVPNRIIKSAIRRLLRSSGIAIDNSNELARLESSLRNVTDVPLTLTLFRSLQVTRHHGQYGFLMKVCRLIKELSLPDEGGSNYQFYNIIDDETRMSNVFEHFVRNFYRLEQDHYAVSAEMISWPAQCVNARDATYLPMMFTDVTLRSSDRIVVVDAKFYKDTFVSRFDSAPRIRSNHLYQLQSYLTNMEQDISGIALEGILLYPSVDGKEVQLDFQLPRHRIRVCTIDLAQPWQHIHHKLLQMVAMN